MSKKAYDQLLEYREALENPPLLVVCDTDQIVIHTNFTATPKRVHTIPLSLLAEPHNLEILRHLFHQPDKLKPGTTSRTITEAAAARFADLAQRIRQRGLCAETVARFLDRVVFCMFAEDVGLLPDGLFSKVVERAASDPPRLARQITALFEAMANGGDFGADAISHFNGDLFNDTPAIELTRDEISALREAARLDWSAIDPSIFGTLFERGLDPDKRSQLGAHYTSREDIELLIEPVVMQPLRREWDVIRGTIDCVVATGKKHPTRGTTKPPAGAALKKAFLEAAHMKGRFLDRLARVTVLDPACGCGNFLYVTLQKLKDLEKEVIVYGAERGVETAYFPRVSPRQFFGIEINGYAYELAQMSLWIGYLQWARDHGFAITDTPILKKMTGFRHMDAILDLGDPDNPKEPEWPKVEFIVGNPPFLGDKLMRRELGDSYVEKLRKLYGERIPCQSDLCCVSS